MSTPLFNKVAGGEGVQLCCVYIPSYSVKYTFCFILRYFLTQWVHTVLPEVRTNHVWRIMLLLRLIVGIISISILFVYTPQWGRQCEEKDYFYTVLVSKISTIPPDDMLIVWDSNGHIVKDSGSFEGIHGGHGFGRRNAERTMILDMCAVTNLVVSHSFFKKEVNKLITYSSCGTKLPTGYILTRHA